MCPYSYGERTLFVWQMLPRSRVADGVGDAWFYRFCQLALCGFMVDMQLGDALGIFLMRLCMASDIYGVPASNPGLLIWLPCAPFRLALEGGPQPIRHGRLCRCDLLELAGELRLPSHLPVVAGKHRLPRRWHGEFIDGIHAPERDL